VVGVTEELTGEDCDDCGTALIRISEDDTANSHNCPVVTCPSCLEIIRRER
jgi:ssDNA-binding Zn-finger/Zn-ribbon topoisomerase 1